MTTELMTIEQPELLQVVNESKIEHTKAEAYAAGYAPFMIQVSELSQAIKTLDTENPSAEDAKTARTNRLALVKVRTAAEEKKKTDKEIIVIEGRLIDGLFKVVENASKLTESEFLSIEKHQERVEAERLAALETERKALLLPYGEVNSFIDLKNMSVEIFDKYLSDTQIAFEVKQQQALAAEKKRIADEKKAEKERIATDKAAAAEKERIRKENEELKKQNELKAKELEAERQKFAEEKAESDRLAKIESDKQAKIQADKDAEIKKLQDQQKAQADAEQKQKDAELAKVQSENNARITREKEAALAPDKVKINLFYVALRDLGLSAPELSTEEGKAIIQQAKEGIDILLAGIKSLSEKLK